MIRKKGIFLLDSFVLTPVVDSNKWLKTAARGPYPLCLVIQALNL